MKMKKAARESKPSPSAFCAFSRMLCIRWAENAAWPVDTDVIPAFHWHSSGLESIRNIQYGFLGEGAGGVFFGHKEFPSRKFLNECC